MNVTCLVRRTSNIDALKKSGCRIVYGDVLHDPEDVAVAVKGHDLVFHLAALTHAIRARDLVELNSNGFKTVVEACAACPAPPKLVYVSSLAAVGPNQRELPSRESSPGKPVSFYGQSKAACETIARQFSDQVPISIVRPPIVLGPGDRHGFEMFKIIDDIGWHFVPSFSTYNFSAIHVDDLATALIDVADRGQCLGPQSESQGVYFAAADEILTYSELGRLIGRALGRRRTRVLRVAMPIFWSIAGANELIGRVSSQARFLNLDKCREANAGSWSCSNSKIKEELGFAPAAPLLERLKQTGNWYRQNGWLKNKKFASNTASSQQVSGAQ
jgi:nucleoside-diphosphate-sugar epimerase